jgi:hypothetical protein
MPRQVGDHTDASTESATWTPLSSGASLLDHLQILLDHLAQPNEKSSLAVFGESQPDSFFSTIYIHIHAYMYVYYTQCVKTQNALEQNLNILPSYDKDIKERNRI